MKNLRPEIKKIDIKRLRLSLRRDSHASLGMTPKKLSLRGVAEVISLICFLLFTIRYSLFAAVMTGGDYNITRGQTGGVGSGYLETDGIKLYHSFSQSSPVGVNETDNVIVEKPPNSSLI
ncbi:MAG: hypothetical protein HY919_08545 [Elusimicrobia bacterium]|nr:hypothetical protein [Elusimicrobiota bacterium]